MFIKAWLMHPLPRKLYAKPDDLKCALFTWVCGHLLFFYRYIAIFGEPTVVVSSPVSRNMYQVTHQYLYSHILSSKICRELGLQFPSRTAKFIGYWQAVTVHTLATQLCRKWKDFWQVVDHTNHSELLDQSSQSVNHYVTASWESSLRQHSATLSLAAGATWHLKAGLDTACLTACLLPTLIGSQ